MERTSGLNCLSPSLPNYQATLRPFESEKKDGQVANNEIKSHGRDDSSEKNRYRIKTAFKSVRISALSPAPILRKVRDLYVDTMMSVGSSRNLRGLVAIPYHGVAGGRDYEQQSKRKLCVASYHNVTPAARVYPNTPSHYEQQITELGILLGLGKQ